MHIDEVNITELSSNTNQPDKRKTTKQSKEKEVLPLFPSQAETTENFVNIICCFVAKRGKQLISERNKGYRG